MKEELEKRIAYLKGLSQRKYRDKSIMERASKRLKVLEELYDALFCTYNF